jgi:hypothetical protein
VTGFTPSHEAKTDQKPFRRSAVKARKAHPAHPVHPVTPAVTSTPAATKTKPETPARERAHDLKPFKPAHVKKTNPGLGQAKQSAKPAAPPKTKTKPERRAGATGATGQSGQGNGKSKGQTQDPVTDAATHGKSGR